MHDAIHRFAIGALLVLLCISIPGCARAPQGDPEPLDTWGPVVELRDDTATWQEGKPAGGWWVTPIHALLLPDGDVLVTGWGRRDRNECTMGGTRKHGVSFRLSPEELNAGGSYAVRPIDEKGSPATDALYCAGHSPLADGQIFYTGGSRYENLGREDEVEWGLDYARLYDVDTGEFTRIAAQMRGGPEGLEGVRWYPTNTRLDNGRVLVTGGFTRYGGQMFANLSVEFFDLAKLRADADPWRELVTHERGPAAMAPHAIDYTHVYLLPESAPSPRDGRGLRVAMIGEPGVVHLFDYGADAKPGLRFAVPTNGARGASAYGSTGALLSTGNILVAGGTTDPITARRIDLYSPRTDSWQSIDMAIGRFHPMSVLLPDGSVLIVNGESMPGFDGDSRRPQVFDPRTLAVTTFPPWPDDTHQRGYHSFALLLKDGRVLTGGGISPGVFRVGCERPDIRIYEPAYLHRGPRPVLADGPEPIRLRPGGASVELGYGGAPLSATGGVVLLALGAATHAFDQNQRYVPLDFETLPDDNLRVAPPADSFRAPPGDYILFLVSEAGVPSRGRHVRVESANGPD